jgi:trigger factor
MQTTKVENILDTSTTKKFLCTIAISEVESYAEAELINIAKVAVIKGCRKGKAPMKRVKEMYFGKAYNDAADKMIRQTIENISKENNFKLASSPNVKINEGGQDANISFEVTFELLPEVPMDFPFQDIQIQGYEVELTEEDIDKELQLIAKKNKDFSVKEGSAEIGDIVVIDTIGRIGGTEFPGGKVEKHDLELGSHSFIPGFEEQLIGASAGESVIVTVTFPSDYHAKELAGKEAQFFTKVIEVKKGNPAEINDELAKKLSLENVETLKQDLVTKIKSYYDNCFKDSIKNEIFDKITDNLSFEVADGMVEKVLQNMLANKDLPTEEIPNLKEEAKGRLRLSFFLNKISEENKIEVTQQDFADFVIKTATESGVNPFQVMEFYNKNSSAKQKLEILLEENKIFDFIYDRITMKKEKITKMAFDEILRKKAS